MSRPRSQALRAVPAEVRRGLTRAGGLHAIKRSVPSGMEVEDLARVFDAVSDPSRLRILIALGRNPLCPCVLRELEPMANPVLSYHLRLLKRAGLVVSAARSNYRIYEATPLGRRLVSFTRRVANVVTTPAISCAHAHAADAGPSGLAPQASRDRARGHADAG